MYCLCGRNKMLNDNIVGRGGGILVFEKINKVDQGKEIRVVKIILSIGFEVSIVLGNSLQHNIYYNVLTK